MCFLVLEQLVICIALDYSLLCFYNVTFRFSTSHVMHAFKCCIKVLYVCANPSSPGDAIQVALKEKDIY